MVAGVSSSGVFGWPSLRAGLSARDRSELLLRAVEAHVGPGGQTGDIVCLTVRRLLPASELAPESEAAV